MTYHFTWIFVNKKKADLLDRDELIIAMLSSWKKLINKHTILGIVPDDFIDDASSMELFFGSDKLDEGLIVQILIGPEEMELLIFNYEDLFDADKGVSKIEFIENFAAKNSLEIFKVT